VLPLFALPASALGRMAGMPAATPPLYCALVALFLTLFAGAYAWLALQASISRPLLTFLAIGKSLAFFTFILLWLLSLGPANAALGSIGDALLAGVFAWWLIFSDEPRSL
jgi:hypothetical protein